MTNALSTHTKYLKSCFKTKIGILGIDVINPLCVLSQDFLELRTHIINIGFTNCPNESIELFNNSYDV